MLHTRNAFFFRKYFKEEVAREKNKLDLNFLGSLHPDKTRHETGFAKLIYGNRDDLGKLLGTIALNVAADQQAIYELIQNADDCKSQFFSVSYNEKYLLCINNGNYFSDNDMSAIINVAGNFKDGEDIGTFGIGFKILHRLVGVDDGRSAIIDDYAGPIIFSWSEYNHLNRFLKGEPIGIYGWGDTKEEYNYERDKSNPWLIKILYTCFPSNLGERIRLKDYETQEAKFDKAELIEMRSFLKQSLQDVNLQEDNYLKNGSIFFLKLGEGKSKFIDDGIDNLKSGISYSFNFLNSLKKIYINGEEIKKQNVQSYSKDYKRGSDEFIEIKPRNINRDIKFSFAFYEEYRRAEDIANTKTQEFLPNFYNFFSMDEEKNGFRFLVHCNAFDMNNDRRKLQPNSQINERLLPILANDIIQYIDKHKERDRDLFLNLYASLLLSKEPKNKPNINNFFFIYIKEYLPQNIPTHNGYLDNPQNIKVKNTLIDVYPSDFGCPEIEWFYWFQKADETLIDEALSSEKLDLDKWNIIKLLEYAISKGKQEYINEWVKSLQPRAYFTFLKEIEKYITKAALTSISEIKLFKFSDEKFYSLNEIFSDEDLVLNYEKTTEIRFELQAIGFKSSFINIAEYPNIYELIKPKIVDVTLFQCISQKVKNNNFRKEQKHRLFFTLAEFENVGAEKLKDLELFKDAQGVTRPLRNLLRGDLQVPNWLFSFKMHIAEYIPELDKYLIAEKNIYQSIIFKNWDFIIQQNPNIKYFYEQVTLYYKQEPENQKLENFHCIYTNEGFKKTEQVFFNIHLNNKYFDDLQNVIYKITGKSTPQKLIFGFLIDDNSPFRISKNENISSFINTEQSFSYYEMLALLDFAKKNNEELFKVAYIQKQDDAFWLFKHPQNVFQYYSNRSEINELLDNQPSFKLFPKDFNPNDFRILGIWQDKGLYLKILQTLEFSENLLPIVKESDKEVQVAYLSKLKNLALKEGEIYDRNSFEHRCLKLAIDCFDTNFQTEFAQKILIDGSLRIKDIAVKDDINFEGITLSLAYVLPKYRGISDIVTKIINQFTDFTKSELAEKVFPISNKKKDEIFVELQSEFNSLQSIEQFAFVLYYSKHSNINYLTPPFLSSIASIDILQFGFDNKFNELANYVNLEVQDTIYPSELALEAELLPSWILTWIESGNKQDRLNFLSLLGVHIESSNIVSIRKFFQTGNDFDIQSKIFAFPQNSPLLVNTLKWLQSITFNTSDSAKLDNLKQIYSRVNYVSDIPLLYVQQISENETVYCLEISNATKYYFESPQKEIATKAFYILQSRGFKMLALDYFKHWQTNIGNLNKIQTTTQLDLTILKNKSVEWNDNAYEQWKASQKNTVFIYNGEKLPYKTTFLEQEVETYTEGTTIERESIIYVCQSVLLDIRNQLAKFINADELIKLYRFNDEVISVIQQNNLTVQDIQELLQLKKWLERERQSSEPTPDYIIKEKSDIERTGISGEKLVYDFLCDKFDKSRVIWASKNEDEPRYDFRVLSENGNSVIMYVDAKASTTAEYASDKVPILIRTRAWNFFKENKEGNFHIARVFNVHNAALKDVKLIQIQLKDL